MTCLYLELMPHLMLRLINRILINLILPSELYDTEQIYLRNTTPQSFLLFSEVKKLCLILHESAMMNTLISPRFVIDNLCYV